MKSIENRKLIIVNKPIGPTPFQVISDLRTKIPQLNNSTMGFAGRLDPLAHGVMLILVDEENKERDKYLGLQKTYEFETLLGIETDSYDPLGLIQNFSNLNFDEIDLKEKTQLFIEKNIGKHKQQYPPFSSKAVNGKQLHWWAKQNRLNEIKIPSKEIEIFEFNLLSIKKLTLAELKRRVYRNIKSVEGFFRQEEVLNSWNDYFSYQLDKPTYFWVLKFRVRCSSGTYMRSLAFELGNFLGCGGLALDIERTNVGDYSIENCLNS